MYAADAASTEAWDVGLPLSEVVRTGDRAFDAIWKAANRKPQP